MSLPIISTRRVRCALSKLIFTKACMVYGAQRILINVCLVQKIVDAILGSPLLHMNFVSKLALHASIDMILAPFLTQAICGIPYLLQIFFPLTIFLRSNIGCTGTLEVLINNRYFQKFL